MKLFPQKQIVGIFRGFSGTGLEFHADLVLPYREDFQSTPMHGQFVLVQLAHEDEAVLGRITSISSQGRLVSGAGEDYGIRAVAEDRAIPEDLREQYLKYRVDIRLLGVIRAEGDKLIFAASHRRLPHVGSKVAFLTDDVLEEVSACHLDGADIGFLAFGEFIHAGQDPRLVREEWMVIKHPAIVPRFQVEQLVARRSFVFARAGFGKSNLVKLLFARLYSVDPTVQKRHGRVPVGSVIFDPEGEYFWPDVSNRPGLADVPELQQRLVVFTNRAAPTDFYQSFVAGGVKLDIRELAPSRVLGVALSPERQDQQNVRKLKGLSDSNWRRLVDEIYAQGHNTDPDFMRSLLHLEKQQDAELYAARANMVQVVRLLHDPSSQMLQMLLQALAAGKLCIVDISQMRGPGGLALAGIVLSEIFEHNQREFTAADPKTIPTIAVVEEAQAVLSPGDTSGESPFVAWVKEGRKYDLGAVLITQQPASISHELLSQGDNWFVFHLLASGDLHSVRKANAHFSEDLLSTLLNEPLPGHGVFWSSSGGMPYPIPIRALSFEGMYETQDADGTVGVTETYARSLRDRFDSALESAQAAISGSDMESEATSSLSEKTEAVDAVSTYRAAAIKRVREDKDLLEDIMRNGVPWMAVQTRLAEAMPEGVVTDLRDWAYKQVPTALDALVGEGKWTTEKRPSKSKPGSWTTWIKSA